MQSCAMQRLQGSGTPSTSGRIDAEALRRFSNHARVGCSRVAPRKLVQCAAYMRILAKPTPSRPSPGSTPEPGSSTPAGQEAAAAAASSGSEVVMDAAAEAALGEAAAHEDGTAAAAAAGGGAGGGQGGGSTRPVTAGGRGGRLIMPPSTVLQGRMVLQPGRNAVAPIPSASSSGAGGPAPGAAAPPFSPNPATSSQLAAQISHARNFPSLLALWAGHRVRLTPLELAALFNRLAALTRPEELTARTSEQVKGLLRELMVYAEDRMPDMVGPEFVFILAALAKLQAAPDTAWLNRWLAVSRVKLADLAPSHLVTALRALVKLEMRQGDLRGLIAFPAWMHYYMGAVRARLPSLSAFDLARTCLSLAELGYQLDRGTLGSLAAGLEPKLDALDSLTLARVLASFSALSYRPPPSFMAAYAAAVTQKLPLFDHKDLSIALLALSNIEPHASSAGGGREVLGGFLAEVAAKLPTFRSSTLGNVLLALADMEVAPDPAWTAAVGGHVQGVMWSLGGPALASCVYGLARCGLSASEEFLVTVRDSSVTKFGAMTGADLVHLGQGLALLGRPGAVAGSAEHRAWQQWSERYCYAVHGRGLSAKQVCEVLEVFTLLGIQPDAVVGNRLQASLLRQGLEHVPLAHAPHLLSYLRGAGQAARPALLNAYCRAILFNRRSLTPDHWGLITQQLALSGYRTAGMSWLVYSLAAMQVKVHLFGPGAAAATLWGVGALTRGAPLPSDRWRAQFGARFESLLDSCDCVQLAEGLWGLVEMGWAPGQGFWERWEARAGALGWALPLAQAQEAVEAYVKVGRMVPQGLASALAEQQQHWQEEQAAAAAGVAAALADAAAARVVLLSREAAVQAAGFSAVKGPPRPPVDREAAKKAAKKQKHRKAAAAAAAALEQLQAQTADAAEALQLPAAPAAAGAPA